MLEHARRPNWGTCQNFLVASSAPLMQFATQVSLILACGANLTPDGA